MDDTAKKKEKKSLFETSLSMAKVIKLGKRLSTRHAP
jgi:hypothetical protein